MLNRVSISLVARSSSNELIGICFGITDFSYWLFVTDLGVIRECTNLGIAKALITKLHELAGGKENIIMYTCPNENAIPFYNKIGMKKSDNILELNEIEWTEFDV